MPPLRRLGVLPTVIYITILGTATVASAWEAENFPLGSSFRSGRFVPLHNDGASATVRPTLWDPVAGSQNKGPGTDFIPYEPLGTDQRLVVLDGADADDAKGLFPEREAVTVPATITGPTAAWESVDGVVFGASRGSAAPEVVAGLLANGARVKVVGETRPPGPWPWKRDVNGWVAGVDVVGPTSRIAPAVYGAVDLRPVGRSPAQRQRVVLIVGLVALAIVGATLLPRRAAMLALGVCAASAIALTLWARRNETVVPTRVTVVLEHGAFQQVDEWTFIRSPGPFRLSIDASAVGWPVLKSGRQLDASALQIEAASTTCTVDRDEPIAFLRRTIEASRQPPAGLTPVTMQWKRMQGLYDDGKVTVLGAAESAGDSNPPTLWLRR